MKIAIVILNWNGRALLEEFLPSVVSFSPEDSVYVADNASTDDSVAFITHHFPKVKIIQNKVNGGYARGYNEALQHVKADVYCLLNSDVAVTENWLSPVIKTFSENENIAVVQPKLLDYKNQDYFEYSGAAGGFIDQFGYPYCRGRVFDTIEKDEGQYDDTAEVFWASGACFFIRKDIFEEAGKLDEDFFAHQEEIDLCWRVQKLGYTVQHVGASEVFHLGGATLDAMNPKKTYLNFRNNLLMLLKYLPVRRLVIILFTRLLLDGVAAMKFLGEGKPSHFTAVLKAHFSFYFLLSKFLKKRTNSTLKKKYYRISSVVWQYYVLNKKYFNQLN